MKIKDLLKQFNLNLELTQEMLNAELQGNKKYTNHHTEEYIDKDYNKKELIHVLTGTEETPIGTHDIELIINTNKYTPRGYKKEIIDYDTITHTGFLYKEEGISIALKYYEKQG